jgi:hypothetical protein
VIGDSPKPLRPQAVDVLEQSSRAQPCGSRIRYGDEKKQSAIIMRILQTRGFYYHGGVPAPMRPATFERDAFENAWGTPLSNRAQLPVVSRCC